MAGNSKDYSHVLADSVTRQTFLTGLGAAAFSCAASTVLAPARVFAETGEPAPLSVAEIAPGVFVHQGVHAEYEPANGGDISNASFVIGDDAVAVIDTGGTFAIGSRLRAAVKAQTDRPIRYIINTHMHPDHVLGNIAFTPDAPEFVAHHKMARGLSARSERYLAVNKENVGEKAFRGTKVVLPERGVKSETTLDLGNRSLRLFPQTTAHTDNDLVIRDERTGTLFLGDILFSSHCPTLDGSILGWIRVLEELKSLQGNRVVPGHGPGSLEWPTSLDPMIRYLSVITRDVRVMIKEGRTISDAVESVAQDEKQNWVLFETHHKRNVSAAFAELEWE